MSPGSYLSFLFWADLEGDGLHGNTVIPHALFGNVKSGCPVSVVERQDTALSTCGAQKVSVPVASPTSRESVCPRRSKQPESNPRPWTQTGERGFAGIAPQRGGARVCRRPPSVEVRFCHPRSRHPMLRAFDSRKSTARAPWAHRGLQVALGQSQRGTEAARDHPRPGGCH